MPREKGDPDVFDELRRRWLSAITYLSRFGASGDGEDIRKAKAVLAEVESDWLRRASLSPTEPDYFAWPTTDVQVGLGHLAINQWQDQGMLAYVGYHVGQASDLRVDERRMLLSRVFRMTLPPLNSPTYLREWGMQSSAGRLQKMAECLAAFARNAKRKRSNRPDLAIRHWEEDLGFLRREFYVGKFGFGWPKT